MDDDPFFRLEEIRVQYGNLAAVRGASISLRRGEVFSLLGPSGCGKTTLLRVAAGFLHPDAGRVILEGQDITALPPNRRAINTVFQNYALFPHLDMWENIAFGLRMARRPRREIREQVERMLDLVDLTEHARKRPAQLSGGQKQRVAIARALINRPRILLLDEPLGALDLKLRQRMLLELDRIHDEVGITFVYVTHDQGEAMSLSDRIAVMHDGQILQVGTPIEIYETPRTSFVASFVGDSNFLLGRVTAVGPDEYCRVSVEGFPDVTCYNDNRLAPGQAVSLSVRPEKFRLLREPPAQPDPHLNLARGVIEDVIYLGAQTKFWVRAGPHRLAILQQHGRFLLDERPPRWNDEVWIGWHGNDGYMLEHFEARDAEPAAEAGGESRGDADLPQDARP